ncbi:hypothetical protein [Streptomyces sp. TLI_171]|nr:hypothetical protein [Streptomyces sp. TLI_171]RKE22075.1 hypothetical protein BX266_5491 [Streptomyces sp. TLI_171]
MNDVIVSVEEGQPSELSADVLDERLIRQLVDRARTADSSRPVRAGCFSS